MITEKSTLTTLDLTLLAPDRPLRLWLGREDGSGVEILGVHSCNLEQIAWFRAGGALNLVREGVEKKKKEEESRGGKDGKDKGGGVVTGVDDEEFDGGLARLSVAV